MESELIEFPQWLVPAIKIKVKEFLSSLQNMSEVFSHEPSSFYYLFANDQLQNFKRFQSIYTSTHMKDIWVELYKISSEATEELATDFFTFEHAYSQIIFMHESNVEKILKSKIALKRLQEALEIIPTENDSPFDHVSTSMPKEFPDMLNIFIENLKEKINKFE
ncbi:TPA: hypothetical protein ACHW7I_001575, partial [Legionella pneumophila]